MKPKSLKVLQKEIKKILKLYLDLKELQENWSKGGSDMPNKMNESFCRLIEYEFYTLLTILKIEEPEIYEKDWKELHMKSKDYQ